MCLPWKMSDDLSLSLETSSLGQIHFLHNYKSILVLLKELKSMTLLYDQVSGISDLTEGISTLTEELTQASHF